MKPSPAVENLKNYCLSRLRASEAEIQKARDYEYSGFVAIGEGLRQLRRDAGVSLDELADEMNQFEVYASHLALLEDGEEWTEGLVEIYIDSVGKIYLRKQNENH